MAVQHKGSIYNSGDLEIDLQRRELRVHGAVSHIGARAFAILEILVEMAGELVAKVDLMERVWPGVFVTENALQVHISAIRKALGSQRASLETVSGRGYRLRGDWQSHQLDAQGPADSLQTLQQSTWPANTNLPIAAAPLVGRSVAAQNIQAQLSAYRLVTLTGVGGIGKTALALDVARLVRAEFTDGAWLVELASLADADLVPSAVARALKLSLGDKVISAEAVARSIGEQNLLLVLDNCEHLIDAAADLAHKIITLCPRTTILTTSRELLRVEGESVYRVPPLDIPAGEHMSPSDIRAQSAIELFIAKAKSLDPAFTGTDNLPLVASVCCQLDGIPLAIEFAAARVAALGVQQVAEGLCDRFSLLTSGRRTAVPRHRTLRATLDWSYDLLTETEQSLLRHLGVFAASFTLDAAAHVIGNQDGAGAQTAIGIASLVNKSIVVPERSPANGRWRLFDTVRAYALEKLASSGELALAFGRHAEFYRDLVLKQSQSGLSLSTADQLGLEIDNVRAALHWSFASGGDIATGITLTAAYVPVWLRLALVTECRDRTKLALDRLTSQPDSNVYALTWLYFGLGATMAYAGDTMMDCKATIAKGLEVVDRTGEARAETYLLYLQWATHDATGEAHAALRLARRLSWLARRKAGVDEVRVSDRIVGTALLASGRLNEARSQITEALSRYPESAQPERKVIASFNPRVLLQGVWGTVLWLQGFPDQAKARVLQCQQEAAAADDILTQIKVLSESVCRIFLVTGDLIGADQAVMTLLNTATRYGFSQFLRIANCWRGVLLIKQNDFIAGTALLRQQLDVSEGLGFTTCFPEFLGMLAEGLTALSRRSEALDVVDQAISRAEGGGELLFVAELYRIKGEILLRASSTRTDAVEHWFSSALEVAGQQGALSWELRAAVSLARLWLSIGRRADARVVLAAVFDRFTEGYNTEDLRTARALLDLLH